MKRTILILIIMLLYVTALSQKKSNITITGIVETFDGNPVSSATIILKKAGKKIVANDKGYFSFTNGLLENDTLIINSVTTKPYSVAINVGRTNHLDLGLLFVEYNSNNLPVVEVSGRLLKSYKSDYSYSVTKTQTSILQIPSTISTVTKELIKDKMQFSLKDITTDVAGVSSYSGFDEYTIRGFRAENARNFNGLRGYNSTYTTPIMANVERVEIIKGHIGTLYGNSDPGGSINLVSKKPLTENRESVTILKGSWNHWRFLSDITGPLNKNKSFLYRFNAGYDHTNSFKNNQYQHAYQLAPSFTFIPNEHLKLNLDFSVSNVNTMVNRGVPGIENDSSLFSTPINLSVNQLGDYLKETDFATSAYGTYKISKKISFNSGFLNYISYQKVAEHGFQQYLSSDVIGLYYTKWDYGTVTNSYTNYFSFHTATGKIQHNIIVGWDYVQTSIKHGQQDKCENPYLFGKGSGIVQTFNLKNPQYYVPDFSTYQLSDVENEANNVNTDVYHTQGLYVQESMNWKKWKILAGLRREFYRGASDDDNDTLVNTAKIQNIWLPKIALLYNFNENLSTYISYDKGFDPFEASSSLQIFKNPFKPIISENIELGAKASIFQKKLLASIAIYQLKVKNTAVNANDPSQPNLYVQHGEDISTGIELELNGNIFKNLFTNITYAYDVAKVYRSDVPSEIGNWKENAPRNTVNTWFKYAVYTGIFRHLSLMFGHSQVGIRHTLDSTLQLPAYIVFNGGLLYQWKHIEFQFTIYNIFNKKYWESAYNNINKWPGTPKSIMAGLTYNF